MVSADRAALVAVAVYAAVLTLRHTSQPAINALCTRDFVTPVDSGSCLCGAGQYCLCTPSSSRHTPLSLRMRMAMCAASSS